MGFAGGAIRAFSDKNPEMGVSSAVKNRDLAKKLKSTTKDYERYKTGADTGYENFLRQFNLQEPGVQQFGQTEVGELNKIYDTGGGSLQAELERLRNERNAAREQGLQRGFQYALGAQNRSRLLRDAGGPSSYDRASLTKMTGDLAIQSLLDRNAQERADFGYLTGMRQGNIGQRANVLDTLARRNFIPSDTQRSLLNTDMGLLQNLMNLDQANTFYAPYKKRSGAESWAQFMDAADQGIMNAVGLISSIYGMGGMGGGGAGGGMGGGGGGGGGFQPAPNFYSNQLQVPQANPYGGGAYGWNFQPQGQGFM